MGKNRSPAHTPPIPPTLAPVSGLAKVQSGTLFYSQSQLAIIMREAAGLLSACAHLSCQTMPSEDFTAVDQHGERVAVALAGGDPNDAPDFREVRSEGTPHNPDDHGGTPHDG